MVTDIVPAVPSRLPWPGSRYPPRTDNLVVTAESGHQRADRPTDERHPVRVSQTTVHQGRLLFGDSRDRILRLCLCVPAGIRPSFWSHGIEISRHRSRAGAHRVLVQADISGYTRYVSRTAIQDSSATVR